jgi:hypothetical protein
VIPEPPKVRRFDLAAAPTTDRPTATIRDPAGYSLPLRLPGVLVAAARLFDGRRTLRDVQAELHRRLAVLIPRDVLAELAARLDEAGYLDTPAQRERQRAVDAAFLAERVRPAVHAGRCYPADPAALTALAAAVAGAAPAAARARPSHVLGAVVPHIDWWRGARVYARGYAMIRAGFPRGGRVIVLGTSHVALPTPAALTRKPFATPLGVVAVDPGAIEQLLTEAGDWLLDAEAAHRWEHSIEVNAVWLRALWPADGEVSIVPLLVDGVRLLPGGRGGPADTPRVDALLRALRRLIADRRVPTLVIAAADLAHLGPLYGDGPVSDQTVGEVERRDRALLAAVLAGDAEAVLAREHGTGRRVCGLAPLWALAALGGRGDGVLAAWDVWRAHGSLVSFCAAAVTPAGPGHPAKPR